MGNKKCYSLEELENTIVLEQASEEFTSLSLDLNEEDTVDILSKDEIDALLDVVDEEYECIETNDRVEKKSKYQIVVNTMNLNKDELKELNILLANNKLVEKILIYKKED